MPNYHSKSARYSQIGFLGILLAVIALSLAQTLFHGIHVAVLDESRKPAPAPDVRLLLDSKHAEFAERLNRWVDDRIGFRDLFIKMKNQIDYSVFRTARKVYIGSNDFLFMRDLTNSRLSIERISDAEFETFKQSFITFADLLAKRGVKLVLVIYPDKSAVYPEHLPHNVPNFPEHGRLEQLKAFLEASSSIVLIDVLRLLIPHKTQGNVYYKTDLHPSIMGAVPVIREIIRRIAEDSGRPAIQYGETFAFRLTPIPVRSEDRFLDLMRPLTEWSDYSSDMYSIGKDEPGGHWNISKTAEVFDFEYISDEESCRRTLPPTVLFGNSFSDMWWVGGMHKYFCAIRRARDTSPVSRFAAFVNTMPPGTKYFILQVVGPQLSGGAISMDGVRTDFIR